MAHWLGTKELRSSHRLELDTYLSLCSEKFSAKQSLALWCVNETLAPIKYEKVLSQFWPNNHIVPTFGDSTSDMIYNTFQAICKSTNQALSWAKKACDSKYFNAYLSKVKFRYGGRLLEAIVVAWGGAKYWIQPNEQYSAASLGLPFWHRRLIDKYFIFLIFIFFSSLVTSRFVVV